MFESALWITTFFLTVSVVLTAYRLFRGPHIADRVVALDLLGIVAIGIFSVYAIVTGRNVYLDLALVIGLLNFLATVAFSWYLTEVRSSAK